MHGRDKVDVLDAKTNPKMQAQSGVKKSLRRAGGEESIVSHFKLRRMNNGEEKKVLKEPPVGLKTIESRKGPNHCP